jgi:hypothetical protein
MRTLVLAATLYNPANPKEEAMNASNSSDFFRTALPFEVVRSASEFVVYLSA